jgi:hypothetical protein
VRQHKLSQKLRGEHPLQLRKFLFFWQAFFVLLRDSLVNKGSGHIDILGGRLLSALFGCGSAALRYLLFDQGFWSITDDYTILVAEHRFDERGEAAHLLKPRAGSPIVSPVNQHTGPTASPSSGTGNGMVFSDAIWYEKGVEPLRTPTVVCESRLRCL